MSRAGAVGKPGSRRKRPWRGRRSSVGRALRQNRYLARDEPRARAIWRAAQTGLIAIAHGTDRFPRPRRDGRADGAASRRRRARPHRLQPQPRQGRAPGSPHMAAAHAASVAEAAAGADAVIACVGNDRRRRRGRRGRLRRDARGRACSSITPPSPPASPACSPRRRASARPALRRRAGLGRPGRRRERHSSRSCAAAREAAVAAATPLMQAYARADRPCRPGGQRPADQDGQPDLHRRRGPGPLRSGPLRPQAGLDADKVLEAISGGAAMSWQMVNRWPTMDKGEFDFGFAVDWMRKDLGLTLEEARAQRRQAAADRSGRPILCRSAGDGRRPAGHLLPDPEARALKRLILFLAAVLLGAAPALAQTPGRQRQRLHDRARAGGWSASTAMLVGDDGKVRQLYQRGERRPERSRAYRLDGAGAP